MNNSDDENRERHDGQQEPSTRCGAEQLGEKGHMVPALVATQIYPLNVDEVYQPEEKRDAASKGR